MSKHSKTIKEAVRRAQQIGGLKVGDTVAHPSEPITCTLLEIKGDSAVIGYQDIRHEFPLRELFDPNVAMKEAHRIQESLN